MQPITLRNYTAGDAAWLTGEHARAYAKDEGFDDTFGPLVASILADFSTKHDPARERGWIAQRGETRLGSIFCVALTQRTAKLRLFYTVENARGQGIGPLLLETCLIFAREAGYTDLQLWTHASHTAACALYKRRGFTCDRSKQVHSFGVDLIEQSWSITL